MKAEEVPYFGPGMSCGPRLQSIPDIVWTGDSAKCTNMLEDVKRGEEEERQLWGGRRPTNKAELHISESGGILPRAPNLKSNRDRDPEPEPEQQDDGTTVVAVGTKRLRSPDTHAPNRRAWSSEVQKLVDGGSIIAEMTVPEEE